MYLVLKVLQLSANYLYRKLLLKVNINEQYKRFPELQALNDFTRVDMSLKPVT